MLSLVVLQVCACTIINLSYYGPLLIFCVFDLVFVGETEGGNRPALVSFFFITPHINISDFDPVLFITAHIHILW